MSTTQERYQVRPLPPPPNARGWQPTTYLVVDTVTGGTVKHCATSGLAWEWSLHMNDPRYPAPSQGREALATAS